MSEILSIVAWLGQAAPAFHGGGNETLATWKAVLTTLLVVVALWQGLNQAFVRGWIRVGRGHARVWLGTHRVLGIFAVGLVVLLSALGLYAIPAFNAPMDSPDRIWHIILAVAAAGLLSVKLATTNRFRAKLYLNLPLGLAAMAALVAIFAITAVPHFKDLLAPAGMASLIVR